MVCKAYSTWGHKTTFRWRYETVCFFNTPTQPPEVFCKKRCSQKFRNIHKKTPVLESLFNNVTALQVWNFVKKRLQHRCFPVNNAKFLRTPILKKICWLGVINRSNPYLTYEIRFEVDTEEWLIAPFCWNKSWQTETSTSHMVINTLITWLYFPAFYCHVSVKQNCHEKILRRILRVQLHIYIHAPDV